MNRADKHLNLLAIIGLNGSCTRSFHLHPDSEHVIFPLGSAIYVRNLHKKSQKCLHASDQTVNCVSLNQSGSIVASGHKASQFEEADILLFDFARRCLLHKLSLHKGSVAEMSFSCSGKYLVSIGGVEDCQLAIWDVESGTALSSVKNNTGYCCVGFSLTSDTVLAAGGVNELTKWVFEPMTNRLTSESVAFGPVKRTFTSICWKEHKRMFEDESGPPQVSQSPDICYASTTSGDLVEADMARCLYRRMGPHNTKLSGGVTCAFKIPNGDLLVGTGDGHIAKVSVSESCPIKIVQMAKLAGVGVSAVTSFGLTQDVTHFFAVTADASLYWVQTESLISELRSTCHSHRINGVAFPAETTDILASAGGPEIRLWDCTSKKELLAITVPLVECLCVGFSFDGKSVLTGWSDGKIRAFGPESGKLIYAINDCHKDGVTAIAGTSDSMRLVSGGVHGDVRVWKISKSTQQLEVLLKEHREKVTAIQVRTSDNARALSASLDGTCIVWDLINKVRLISVSETSGFRSVCYHPDFSQFVTIANDKRIMYWDATDGEPLRELYYPDGDLHNFVVVCDGIFCVGGNDKLVNVFDYDYGESIGTSVANHSGNITCAAVAKSSAKFLVTGADDGGLYFWSIT